MKENEEKNYMDDKKKKQKTKKITLYESTCIYDAIEGGAISIEKINCLAYL